jgi:hypothetical protein
MGPNMPDLSDWLRYSADADKGLFLMLFVSLVGLAWVSIARFIMPSMLQPMARVFEAIWFGSLVIAMIAWVVVR